MPFRARSRNKVLTINWDGIQEISDSLACFCLTKQQATTLLGLTPYLRWLTRWDTEGILTQTELDNFVDDLEYRLLQMNCIQYRQSPINPCQWEISYDEGQTWALLFDMELCLAPLLADIGDLVTTESERILKELHEKYTGTAQSISDKLVYDASGNDVFRNDSLCALTRIIVPAMCQAELQRRDEQAEVWSEVGDILRSIGQVALAFGQTYITLGTGIASAFLEFASVAWQGVSDIVLQDETAQGLVACCMYNSLKGSTITESAFSQSLQNCNFTFGTYESQIAGAIEPMLDSLDFYLSFLQQWADMYDFAKAGFLSDCPCEPDWCHTFDFSIDDGGFIVDNDYLNNPGLYAPATAWIPTDTSDDDGHLNRSVGISRALGGEFNVTRVIMTFDYSRGQFDSGILNAWAIADADEAVLTAVSFDNATNGNGQSLEWNGDIDSDKIRILLRTSKDEDAPYNVTGSALLLSVEICGNGTEPTW